MKNKRKISLDEIGKLIAFGAFIFGGWLRILPPLMAGFPINDGGLFYIMAQAIQGNQYQLPTHVHYNGLSVPFAYPPLAFYVASAIGGLLDIPLISIFTWLPAIVLIGTLFAFYALAKTIFNSEFKAGIATLFFAFTPRAITWLIMGGGVTRSFGQLFLILAVQNIYFLFKNRTPKHLWVSILFSSLVCLSHPEAAVHTIGFALILWVLIGRDRKGTILALEVAGGTILLTSIWWLPTINRLGLAPFFSAVQTGLHSANTLAYFLISFSEEPFLTIIAVLAIIGLAVKIVRQEFLLPLWYVLPFVIEPRNAPNVSAIPMALLASTALQDLIFPALAQFESQIRKIEFRQSLQSRIEKGLFVYLGLCMLAGMYYYDLTLTERKVSPENQKAFQWVAENTPFDSRFLVVTGNTDLFVDWTLEWFPALTNRVSLTTIQGNEWLDGKLFLEHVDNIQALQRCIANTSPLKCTELQSSKLGSDYDYIFIARKTSPENYSKIFRGDALINDLSQDDDYSNVYQNDEAVIFKHIP